MKNILTFFLLLAGTLLHAQDLRFTYQVNSTATTSDVKIFVQKNQAGTENMVGFTSNLYYDNLESTFLSFNTTSLSAIGWNVDFGYTPFAANSNPAISINHNGFFTINVFDQNFAGTNIDAIPVHILTVTFDNTPGTTNPGVFYLASTSENHPALVYLGNDAIDHPVIVDHGSTFPVEWLSFEAAPQEGRTSLLSWATASELNNRGFEVQRRTQDGQNQSWEALGFVEGQGNHHAIAEYSFVDYDAAIGENLYRLKQIDLDGAVSHSRIRSVYFEPGMGITIFPNPTADQVQIRFDERLSAEEPVSFRLSDMGGRLLQKGILPPLRQKEISLASLPEGAYLLEVMYQGKIITEEIVKIR